ncbi:hypothetical protein KP803_08120 [Vibrio sp. ZSDE26]|uniref:Uncharacterized protein n=1 Tax=Vibrio amylolyticus TaxID=2847292 RepID=A0A9X2BGU4_9VIBR|nr:hypothetical protein [Vibrio amylolyticus]MCK6263241.1 hypothetical protein [Vibrio amylolyticus]
MKIRKIRYLFQSGIAKFSLLRSFFTIYRIEVSANILLLSFLQFTSRYMRLAVMFIPIKIFLLLASDFLVPDLLSGLLDKRGYIVFLLSFTVFIYIVNIVQQIFFSRLEKKQDTLIEVYVNKGNDNLPKKLLFKNIKPTYKLISDLMTISCTLVLFYFISPYYAYTFLFSMVLYSMVIEYVAFTDNRYAFLDKLGVDPKQIVEISSSLLYLFLLVMLFFVYTYIPFPIHNAILLLFGSRIVVAAVKGYLISANKLLENDKRYNNLNGQ